MYQSFVTPGRSSENDVRESKNVKSTSVQVDTEIKQILPKQAQEQTSQPKTALERALCDPKCVIRGCAEFCVNGQSTAGASR
ncbi:hypothetical protein, partial [Comamonas aquatica]|uniref:hypothetical protein n=1 Tax=Comamonas aquatica TaxID=225991 RepID=UPI00244A3D4B